MRVGVIGGGVAGLAAGYELARHGIRVEVWESAPFLGGQASTFPVGGTPLERGYHHLFLSDVDFLALARELGVRVEWLPSRVGLFHGGRLWPFTTPAHLLRFSPLPLADRLRLGLTALWLQRVRSWRRLEPFTAAAFLPPRVGRRAYEAVWEPLLRGKFGARYDRVGMVWFWGKIRLRFASRGRLMAQERLGYPEGSFGALVEALARRIRDLGGQVATGVPVRRVVTADGRAAGLEVGREGEVHTRFYDAIVATVPSHVLLRLVPPLPEGYARRLREVEYLAAVLLVLELDRPLTPFYWLNIADRSLPFVAVIEHTNFLPPERYGGRHIVYLSNYLDRDHPLFGLDGPSLFQAYLPHLRRLNPAFDPSWVQAFHHHREPFAQPLIGPGYSARVPDHHTPIPRLYLANTTQIYPEDRGTNYSIRLGRKVARLLLRDFGLPVKGSLPRPAIPDSVTVEVCCARAPW